MGQSISLLLRILLLQIVLCTVCSTYSYIVQPRYELSEILERENTRPTKRAFDRVESNGFGLVKRTLSKRSFDRLDMADFGLRKKRAFDRIARAEFGLEGFRRKRAFDRLSIAEFGLRRKRAFDRLGGTEFGLIKRSPFNTYPTRDELVDDLASSVMWLRDAPASATMRTSASVEEQID